MTGRIRVLLCFLLCAIGISSAQEMPSTLFSGMKWRLIGPFRGGRALTAVGVPGQPNLFYFGAVGGGVWKSTDAGFSWQPIFDSQPIASIGAMAVAPSNPDIIYVGSGEADMRSDITYGNGIYKSTDAGKTWSHIGLADTQQIGRILIDPRNPDVVYVAALGHAYGPNSERGVFRTTDGGKSWQRVLHKDDNTGAIDLAFDPRDSRVIYASLWQTRRPPWNVYPPSKGPGGGLYKTNDGGDHWQHLEGNGLPSQDVGRIGIAVAPSNPDRVYLTVDAKDGGIYRSDDAGKTWTRIDSSARVWSRGWYFGQITVDPRNPDVIYAPNVSIYKSTDGGKSFTAFKGAPGGDDYHSVWIDPADSNRIITASDQGTVITLNGGQTWSSWYNQPTGQMYHVATDTRFPYWVYGAEQDSGAVAGPSRSQYSSITQNDWRSVTVGGESDMLAPDPLNPNIVFGGRVTRYDWTTAQNQNVSPEIGRPGPFRGTWTLPLVFSAKDQRKLYFSFQFLFRTTNGGNSWDQISPDLTRENPPPPPNLDALTAHSGLDSPRKGVIYAIAPSPLDANLIWAGTDDGLIHLSEDDGKSWRDITPRELTPWSKVGIIEASHFDRHTAYAAVDRHRLDDLKPYIYRTRDAGATWKLVVNGIPEGRFVNVVREDPQRRGLLFAGTELGVYVSFNDGESWQPLQLNLPSVSVRDMVVKGNDLVIATHGRAFWVLDDISALRQAEPAIAQEPAHLFRPATALRLRPGSDQATPYPPEIAHADNPSSGAVIDYFLQSGSSAPVTLEILDSKGALVRRYSSTDKPPAVVESNLPFPMFWVRPPQVLAATVGMHRFVWDMHHAPRTSQSPSPGRRGGGLGPFAPPGDYTVRLTVEGKTYSQPLTLMKDPRVEASDTDLIIQFDNAQRCEIALAQIAAALQPAIALLKQVEELRTQAKSHPELAAPVEEFARQLSAVVGPARQGYGPPLIPLQTDQTSLRRMTEVLGELESAIESADVAPTTDQIVALKKYRTTMEATVAEWQRLSTEALPRLNAQLRQAGLQEIKP